MSEIQLVHPLNRRQLLRGTAATFGLIAAANIAANNIAAANIAAASETAAFAETDVAVTADRAVSTQKTAQAMADAAKQFLEKLTPSERTAASFSYDDAERLNWHYIPRPRKGISLRELSEETSKAAHALLASGLSASGYEQATSVMGLEEMLFLIETGDRAKRRERRDPERFYFSVFGTPGSTGKWGWRVEGHHLCLNYAIENGQVVGSSPEFYGANPAKIEAGPGRTLRVLAGEEDLARQLLASCSTDQHPKMLVSPSAPDDIRGANKPNPEVSESVGLSGAAMSDEQRKLLNSLVEEYLKNMPAEVAEARRARIAAAGWETVFFAWWGGPSMGDQHAYRVQGPTFQIEYNNTQNDANHIHCIYRELVGDFGMLAAK